MATSEEEINKKLRAVRKKLAAIEKLKERDFCTLDDAAKLKVASEGQLKQEEKELEAELTELEWGAAAQPTKASAPAPAPAPVHTPAPAPAPTPAPAAKSKAKAKAKAATAAPAPPPPPAPAQPAAAKAADADDDVEKRIRNLKKKLRQVDQLKEKGGKMNADEKAKVAAESELKRELEALENGEDFVPLPSSAPSAASAAATATTTQPAEGDVDEHAQARADALMPSSDDLGLLIDDETEKRFKSLQKKLRDIAKLWELPSRDKLQAQKLQLEPGLIEEIGAIRAKAEEMKAERRAKFAAAQKSSAAAAGDKSAFKPAARVKKPAWECYECGAKGEMKDLIGSDGAMACYKCGSAELKHNAPEADEEDDDDDEQEGEAEEKEYQKKSEALKTARQKKAPGPASKADTSGPPKPESARWPELQEVLESGDRGVDKSRQKKALEVSRSKDGAPYDTFDTVLLKCNFLTRVELKLPAGVLSSDAFQLYFPGNLSESLVELILKENQLTSVPPGIQQLARIRAIDLSHNAIASLPSVDTWDTLSTTLELLDLSFNKLTSVVELSPLKKLSQLKLDANQLTNLDGISWSELKQLSTFSAMSNQITAIPEGVGEHAVALEWMEMSENKLVTVPTNISELKKLKQLNLAGNPIKDSKIVKANEKGAKELKTYLAKIGGGKKK
mmetsp:Transcript_50297/g.106891  ORF Transcript_50297/g.106891 Transcript_50297/m.106891 type:complete len:676 (-) Transcript_50297:252-2279(-)|eukprot:CAMPEP_0206444842 /NCGR_PEP_ID=MMETSP0324_2-20121206/15144_1 /ASSEMBLY_ACC=CAM_ASM_000836 /TAXON_ID=2866 /ORGANISM="Crypthecodinium cohnii, Strain Seligo" /LENGTH=675 /DNA_ID=CAMNT_0053912925 /DNA_START=123 /DNA_END=2150 /DNA_ORIENTATION=+